MEAMSPLGAAIVAFVVCFIVVFLATFLILSVMYR